jgi:hypothetical protein
MVTDLVGSRCDEVVACAYIRSDWPHKDPNELCMEATLLVVEDPAAAEEKEGEAGVHFVHAKSPSTPGLSSGGRVGVRMHICAANVPRQSIWVGSLCHQPAAFRLLTQLVCCLLPAV